MAQDFPEDKYTLKLRKGQRSFAENLLHVTGVDYNLMRPLSGSNVGRDLGENPHNPSRDVYKTKADVEKLIQQAVAHGANLIKQQGEAGLDKATKFAWGNRQVGFAYTHLADAFTQEDFLNEIRDTCTGFAARKGYTNGGPEESNDLGPILKGMGVARDHGVGEIIAKCAEFRREPRRVVAMKIAGWAWRMWTNCE